MKGNMKQVLIVKRRLALHMAESLESEFCIRGSEWDVDRAADLLYAMIPMTNAEAQAEWDATVEEQEREDRKPKGPSLGKQLRDVLGFGEEVSLTETIKALIERLKEKK